MKTIILMNPEEIRVLYEASEFSWKFSFIWILKKRVGVYFMVITNFQENFLSFIWSPKRRVGAYYVVLVTFIARELPYRREVAPYCSCR